MSYEFSDLAVVKKTNTGPELFIAGVKTRVWLGTNFNEEADALAETINLAYLDGRRKAMASAR